jgi:hypothetical protein
MAHIRGTHVQQLFSEGGSSHGKPLISDINACSTQADMPMTVHCDSTDNHQDTIQKDLVRITVEESRRLLLQPKEHLQYFALTLPASPCTCCSIIISSPSIQQPSTQSVPTFRLMKRGSSKVCNGPEGSNCIDKLYVSGLRLAKHNVSLINVLIPPHLLRRPLR